MQEGEGSIPGWEMKSPTCHVVWPKNNKNLKTKPKKEKTLVEIHRASTRKLKVWTVLQESNMLLDYHSNEQRAWYQQMTAPVNQYLCL